MSNISLNKENRKKRDYNKTEEYWESKLTKDFLFDEYCVKHKNIFIIAKEVSCGVLRLKSKLKEFSLTRKRVAHNRRISNKDKIERMGFKLLEEYSGRHNLTKIECHCGKEFITLPGHLLSKHTKSCGCIFNDTPKSYKGYKTLGGKEFNRVRYGAIRRNIIFNITIQDIYDKYESQDKKCKLSNIPLEWDSKKGYGNASVDRIDNNQGYTVDNIMIVHKDINMMKRHHSLDYFKYLCHKIGKNYNGETNFLKWESENVA